MAWSSTYSHTLAIAIDMLTASLFWNKSDLTVSSLCGFELRKQAKGQGAIWSLVILGKGLNAVTKGKHCEQAITADYQRTLACQQLIAAQGGIKSNDPNS